MKKITIWCILVNVFDNIYFEEAYVKYVDHIYFEEIYIKYVNLVLM